MSIVVIVAGVCHFKSFFRFTSDECAFKSRAISSVKVSVHECWGVSALLLLFLSPRCDVVLVDRISVKLLCLFFLVY